MKSIAPLLTAATLAFAVTATKLDAREPVLAPNLPPAEEVQRKPVLPPNTKSFLTENEIRKRFAVYLEITNTKTGERINEILDFQCGNIGRIVKEIEKRILPTEITEVMKDVLHLVVVRTPDRQDSNLAYGFNEPVTLYPSDYEDQKEILDTASFLYQLLETMLKHEAETYPDLHKQLGPNKADPLPIEQDDAPCQISSLPFRPAYRFLA